MFIAVHDVEGNVLTVPFLMGSLLRTAPLPQDQAISFNRELLAVAWDAYGRGPPPNLTTRVTPLAVVAESQASALKWPSLEGVRYFHIDALGIHANEIDSDTNKI